MGKGVRSGGGRKGGMAADGTAAAKLVGEEEFYEGHIYKD